jgi:hypothetical protein
MPTCIFWANLTPFSPQREMLARTLGPVDMVFHCDCAPAEMIARALARASEAASPRRVETQRSDDDEGTVARVIARFEGKCRPVLRAFGADGVLHRVPTGGGCTVAQSFASVMDAWTEFDEAGRETEGPEPWTASDERRALRAEPESKLSPTRVTAHSHQVSG